MTKNLCLDIFVVYMGGFQDQTKVKAIPLLASPGASLTFPRLPDASVGGVAATLEGKLTFCLAEGCQQYNPCSDTWQTTVFPGVDPARGFAKGVSMPDGRWWIFGGADNGTYNGNVTVYEQGGFTPKSNMPADMGTRSHCAVAVNATHIFLAGGKTGQGYGVLSKATYLLDTTTEEWTALPDLRIPRFWISCGVYGHEGMVVGKFQGPGINEPEIISLETLQRRDGPPTPMGLKFYNTRTVPYEGSFLTIGGYLGTSNIKDIYWYNPSTQGWDLFGKTLDSASASHAVTVVDSAQMTC